jgi:hypothetical protein
MVAAIVAECGGRRLMACPSPLCLAAQSVDRCAGGTSWVVYGVQHHVLRWFNHLPTYLHGLSMTQAPRRQDG